MTPGIEYSDQQGVVIGTGYREEMGRYGFLALSQEIDGMALLYFDESEEYLANPGEPFADGTAALFGITTDFMGWPRPMSVRMTQDPIPAPFTTTPLVEAKVVEVMLLQKLGYLSLPDDKRAVFHFSYLPWETWIPEVGQIVQCRIAQTGSGLHAYDISGSPSNNESLEGEAIRKQLREAKEFAHQSLASHREEADRNKDLQEKQKPALDDGPFRFDRKNRRLILHNRRHIAVPPRYAGVIDAMLDKESSGGYLVRRSGLTYQEVAMRFEEGKLQEPEPPMSTKDRKAKLKSDGPRIRSDAKEIAQEFRRQFSRWLRQEHIDANAVIKCNKKSQTYFLSRGWHGNKLVTGDSEASVATGSGHTTGGEIEADREECHTSESEIQAEDWDET